MMWQRFRTHENEIKPNGFSWDRTAYSRLMIYLCAWPYFAVRLRWKYPKEIREGQPRPFFRTFDARFFRAGNVICKGVRFDFERLSISVNGVSISLELLDAMTNPRPGVSFTFERTGDYVTVREAVAKQRWESSL